MDTIKSDIKDKNTMSKPDVLLFDNSITISFISLMRIITKVFDGSLFSLIPLQECPTTIYITVENGDNQGGLFYSTTDQIAFSISPNWAETLDYLISIKRKPKPSPPPEEE